MKRNNPTVRLVKRVTADFPFLASLVNPDKPTAVAEPAEHLAYMNHYGAVSVLTPGGRLGVKPNEFAWVHGEPKDWGRQETAERKNGCCWTPCPDDKDEVCPICRGSGFKAPTRTVAWRDFQALAQGWEPLYGPHDAERMWDDPQAALEDVHGPVVSGPVALHVYERRDIDDDYIRRAARDLLDWWAERFSEDFGSDENEGENGGELADAEAFVRACAARAVPWQCEFTGIAVMLDEADIVAFGVRVAPAEVPDGPA